MKMEGTFKRLLSVVLVCAMLAGMLPQLSVAVNSVEPSTEPSGTTQTESANLITNGGFETYTAETRTQESNDPYWPEMIATGWYQYYGGVTTSMIDGRNGKALKISRPSRLPIWKVESSTCLQVILRLCRTQRQVVRFTTNSLAEQIMTVMPDRLSIRIILQNISHLPI